ncbi:MAG: amidohydrolase family protein [Gammaproteobacteria bacterium]
MPQFDTLIRGGKVVDGTGAPPRTADIGIAEGRIAAIGHGIGTARQEVSADGLLVTPGWVDIHTHYDGQVTWDPVLEQSLWHGVTTVVMGNCGVGFAPAQPDRHDWLIGLMEGVEDIPAASLAAGMPWNWESFPQYLDALAATPRTIDVAAQVPHGALRAYVMGERGARNEPATPADLAAMAALTREAIEAGAVGFSSSRTAVHIANDGNPVPGTFAAEEELVALGRAVTAAGHGLLEVVTAGVAGEDNAGLDREMEMLRRVARAAECPVMFLLVQHNGDAQQWKRQLKVCEDAAREGVTLIPQTAGRPVNILFCFEGEHPWKFMPSYQPIKDLPFPERLARLRDPALRARLLAEQDPHDFGFSLLYKSPTLWQQTFATGARLNHTPTPDQSIAAIAAREQRSPWEVAYDLLLEQDGRAFLMYTVTGYAEGNPESVFELIRHPQTLLGLSDAGAHVRFVCDGGVHSYILRQWCRDWGPGHRYHLPLEFVVRKLTGDNARAYGFHDRGTLEIGKRADLNLIDLARLRSLQPEMRYDLPAGMPRLVERVEGYVATYVKGEPVQADGRATGARPGGLLRGRRA